MLPWCWWFSFARTVTLASGTPQISVQLNIQLALGSATTQAVQVTQLREGDCLIVLHVLYNRLLGCLHHCLATGTLYSESIAFPAPLKLELAIAA
ncbi:hypothetical protein ABZ763_31715 [Streptomyces bacillaris]|uniref:hypothetical protein n=1 Tax=Streptomyces bacillaris TaxID=68179 RepID=UPI0034600703